jgi:hypothetical protein
MLARTIGAAVLVPASRRGWANTARSRVDAARDHERWYATRFAEAAARVFVPVESVGPRGRDGRSRGASEP